MHLFSRKKEKDSGPIPEEKNDLSHISQALTVNTEWNYNKTFQYHWGS